MRENWSAFISSASQLYGEQNIPALEVETRANALLEFAVERRA